MSSKLPGSTARNTNMKAVGPKIEGGGTARKVIVGSGIGSVSALSKSMDVNRNAKAQPAKRGDGTWTKRAAQARAMAKPQKAAHTKPVNHAHYALKRVKPS